MSPATAALKSRARPRARARPVVEGKSILLKHNGEWRRKRQDILLSFTGTVKGPVRSAVRRVVRDAKDSGIDVLGKPEVRTRLPRGHPPIEGIEHVDPVIMTITLNCSMKQLVDMLTPRMPFGVVIVPIPSERFIAW